MPHLLRRAGTAALVLLGGLRAHAPLEPSLAFAFTGCVELKAGLTCDLSPDPAKRELRVWVDPPDGVAPTLLLDGRQLSPRAREGALLFIDVPQGATSLEVRSTGPEGRARARIRLSTPPAVEALDDADRLRHQGRFDEALERVGRTRDSSDLAVRARATGLVARIRLAKGATDDAIGLFEEALTLDRAAGRLSAEFLDRFALAYTLVYHRGRFQDARHILEPLRGMNVPSDGSALLPYYEALVAHETGDVRTAIALLRRAVNAADRLRLDAQRLDALVLLIDVLVSIGRDAESRALIPELKSAVSKETRPCKRAEVLHNIGWFMLATSSGDDAGSGRGDDPLLALNEARSLYSGTCRNAPQLATALNTLALATLASQDPDAADQHLQEARRAVPEPDPRLARQWASIEAQIALQRGDAAAALALFERLALLGASGAAPTAQWRGAVGRGQAYEKLGRVEEARKAYEGAENFIDRRRSAIPFGEGRGSFLGRHDLSARSLVDLLTRHGTAEEAATAARRSRARALSSLDSVGRIAWLDDSKRARWEGALLSYRRKREALDARSTSDWRLAADELARVTPSRRAELDEMDAELDRARELLGHGAEGTDDLPTPTDGELLLVYHPIRAGWAGFAVSASGTTLHLIPALDANGSAPELTRSLLDPFQDQLHRARRLRILAYGPLQSIDFHDLPWRGRPLHATVPVAYGADLPRRPSNLKADAPARIAVVVADPRSDLPAARLEGRAVASTLAQSGWAVTLLENQAATTSRLRQELEKPGVTLLHYAGHARFSGMDAAASGLPLAGQTFFGMGDVLSLARVPRYVVLSGCDTARNVGDDIGPSISQAFLLAGANAVIGASRRTDDIVAHRMMLALYESTTKRGLEDPTALLAGVALELERSEPGQDWASFRALVP